LSHDIILSWVRRGFEGVKVKRMEVEGCGREGLLGDEFY